MNNTKQSVTSLFQSDDAADLGIKGKGSEILINNLNATTLPMCMGAPIHTLETDDITIIMFLLDKSGSMDMVQAMLRQLFNEIMIGGLRGASKKAVNTILVGALRFGTHIEPMWGGGFMKLVDVPLLDEAEYYADGRSTNLYQAMIDGITAAGAYATQVFQETGTPPRVIIVPLTDGADNVKQATAAEVLAVTNGLSKELWTLACAVFETREHVDGEQIARDSGFDVFNFKKEPGETDADIQRRFRHMMGTLSSHVIRTSQANVGGANQSGSFWQQ